MWKIVCSVNHVSEIDKSEFDKSIDESCEASEFGKSRDESRNELKTNRTATLSSELEAPMFVDNTSTDKVAGGD